MPAPSKADQLRALREAQAAALDREAKPEHKSSAGGVEGHAVVRRGAATASTTKGSASTEAAPLVGIKPGPAEAKPRRGRPRIGEPRIPRDEPWKALGMSERTWYRRQAEKRSK